MPKTLARVYDPIRAEIYRKSGVDTICTSTIGAGIFHDLLLSRPQRTIEDYLDYSAPNGAGPQEE
ncbi:MAG: hypothetical protein IMF16_09515 [Proteobacteria bacterium]|nr:hypothetical protein [Pseudomonadota bacterium]